MMQTTMVFEYRVQSKLFGSTGDVVARNSKLRNYTVHNFFLGLASQLIFIEEYKLLNSLLF
jgi:hypothetical protein